MSTVPSILWTLITILVVVVIIVIILTVLFHFLALAGIEQYWLGLQLNLKSAWAFPEIEHSHINV